MTYPFNIWQYWPYFEKRPHKLEESLTDLCWWVGRYWLSVGIFWGPIWYSLHIILHAVVWECWHAYCIFWASLYYWFGSTVISTIRASQYCRICPARWYHFVHSIYMLTPYLISKFYSKNIVSNLKRHITLFTLQDKNRWLHQIGKRS
jgi:hypothetical protein